jgi:hypothetical protein
VKLQLQLLLLLLQIQRHSEVLFRFFSFTQEPMELGGGGLIVRRKGDGGGKLKKGETYGLRPLQPYGYLSQTYGITKSDAQRMAARERARNRPKGLGKVQVSINRTLGLQASARNAGIPEAQVQDINTLGDYSRAMAVLRSRFQRKNGRYVTQKIGKKTFRVRNQIDSANVRPRASAYDIRQITGKTHGQQVARYLSVLGPKSIGEFIAFDKLYYPKGKGQMSITEDELLDFIAYSIAPWENANVGGAKGTHWGPRVQGAPDIAKLQRMLNGLE